MKGSLNFHYFVSFQFEKQIDVIAMTVTVTLWFKLGQVFLNFVTLYGFLKLPGTCISFTHFTYCSLIYSTLIYQCVLLSFAGQQYQPETGRDDSGTQVN